MAGGRKTLAREVGMIGWHLLRAGPNRARLFSSRPVALLLKEASHLGQADHLGAR
jgi:hypothetical protein